MQFNSSLMKNRLSADRSGKSGGSGKYLKVFDYKALGIERLKLEANGEYFVDFLPFPVDINHPDYASIKKDADAQGVSPIDWWITFHTHQVKTASGNQKFICNHRTYGKACPFCEEKSRLFDNGGYEANKDAIKDMNSSQRDMFLVHNREDGKLYILEYSNYYLGKYLKAKIERAEHNGPIPLLPDPGKNGLSVRFWVDEGAIKGRDGKQLPGAITQIEFVPRPDAVPDAVMDQIVALDPFFVRYSYEDTVGFLDGSYFVEDDEEQPAPEPKKEVPVVQPKTAERQEDPVVSKELTPEEIRAKRRAERMAKQTPECPGGGKFGESIDSLDECDDCPLYAECEEAFNSHSN